MFNKIAFLLKIFQLLKRILIGEKIYFSFLLGFALEIFILVTFQLDLLNISLQIIVFQLDLSNISLQIIVFQLDLHNLLQ